MSSGRPAAALLARCGSAIWPRTMETRSARPSLSTLSAFSGVRMWLSAVTSAWRTVDLITAARSAPSFSGYMKVGMIL